MAFIASEGEVKLLEKLNLFLQNNTLNGQKHNDEIWKTKNNNVSIKSIYLQIHYFKVDTIKTRPIGKSLKKIKNIIFNNFI